MHYKTRAAQRTKDDLIPPAMNISNFWLLVCGILLTVLFRSANAQSPVSSFELTDQFNLLFGDQFSYDDNLYRVPSNFGISSLGPNTSRKDHLNSITIGIDGTWAFFHQAIKLSGQVNNNKYLRNTTLNNTSGTGELLLDWMVTTRLSGTGGIDFSRSLAGFANTLFFAKDLVNTTKYFATARFELAQKWRVNTGVSEQDTTHSAIQRAEDQDRSKTGNINVEYVTDDGNSAALEFQRTDTTYPFISTFNGQPFNRDYTDNLGQILAKYTFSGMTRIEGNAGYLNRHYGYSDVGSFSGSTWRLTLDREVSGKTRISVAVWRELTAYLDASTDYFVSRGESISVQWTATAKTTISLSASYAGQAYLRNSTSALIFDIRHDAVRAAQAALQYAPRDRTVLKLMYRFENRGSTAELLSYDDRVASVQLSYQLF